MNKPSLLLCLVVLVTAVSFRYASADTIHGKMNPEAVLRVVVDKDLSPFTGYTRQHWLEICEKLIAGVLPYFDVESGKSDLPGTPGETALFQEIMSTDEHWEESFDRVLMLPVTYVVATGRDRVPGYDGSITRPFLNGIIRFTDPQHPDYYGKHKGHSIFGANMALAILLAPEFFWDPLTARQQKNMLAFMERLAYTPGWDCNHWYFHLMALPVLSREEVEVDREYFDGIFRRLLNWYQGDGWFLDGGNFTFDYYNLWGFQLYNHALVHFDKVWSKKYATEVAEINKKFQHSFLYMFGRDGGPIPWGRSLSYRFASLSALGWSLVAGNNTLPPGQARRIASGCLKYFWEHGALSANGTLEPGWWGPNSAIGEEYQARGAPYWAAHGLAPLLLPADHPFWTEVEQPMPADGAGGRLPLPGAQMALKVSPIDGEARNYIAGGPIGHAGQWQRGTKYFQHSYSSYLGWCVTAERGPELGQGRSGVSLDGALWKWRSNPRPIFVEPDRVVSSWDFSLSGPDANFEHFGTVTTHTLIGDEGELHVFWHNSATPLYLWMGGYGISVPHGTTAEQNHAADSTFEVHTGRYHSYIRHVFGPEGKSETREVEPQPGFLHSHLFGGCGVFPRWISSLKVSPHEPVVVYVHGTRDREPLISDITARRDSDRLKITFEGRQWTVALPVE